jgi:RimJ/RimL family protein N-acetyltransferase
MRDSKESYDLGNADKLSLIEIKGEKYVMVREKPFVRMQDPDVPLPANAVSNITEYGIRYYIYTKDRKKVAGVCAINNLLLKRKTSHIELRYEILDEECHGKGIATAGARHVVSDIINNRIIDLIETGGELNINCTNIWLELSDDNIASQKVAERAGFELYKGGASIDVVKHRARRNEQDVQR